MTQPFRIRAKEVIIQAYTQRLCLIKNGKSRNFITYDQCTTMREEVDRMYSDGQLAKYILHNNDLIRFMIPACNKQLTARLGSLGYEANRYANKIKPNKN